MDMKNKNLWVVCVIEKNKISPLFTFWNRDKARKQLQSLKSDKKNFTKKSCITNMLTVLSLAKRNRGDNYDFVIRKFIMNS